MSVSNGDNRNESMFNTESWPLTSCNGKTVFPNERGTRNLLSVILVSTISVILVSTILTYVLSLSCLSMEINLMRDKYIAFVHHKRIISTKTISLMRKGIVSTFSPNNVQHALILYSFFVKKFPKDYFYLIAYLPMLAWITL